MNSVDHFLNKSTAFKKCSACGFEWSSRNDFLGDPNTEIIGYQVHFEELTAGLFFFNHSCRGTLTIHAHAFRDLYDGPIFTERATDSEECPGYCLHQDELQPCRVQCDCAYVREIIQVINNWTKS